MGCGALEATKTCQGRDSLNVGGFCNAGREIKSRHITSSILLVKERLLLSLLQTVLKMCRWAVEGEEGRREVGRVKCGKAGGEGT